MEGSEAGVERLLKVIERLRSADGCPWDREQTLESLKRYLVEECYELLDAIDGGDIDEHRDELGDVLLQVVLQSQIRSEQGQFCFDDVANHLAEKMVRRHPHVFGSVEVNSSADVERNWAKIKAEEKAEPKSLDAGIPRGLPQLMRADKVQRRAARVGFDWDCAADVMSKIEEELSEVREALAAGDEPHLREELGDLLFAVVNLVRFMKFDSESVLGDAVQKFCGRFDMVRALVEAGGRTMEECTLEELDGIWDNVKGGEV
jgi:tetrapyrrole methylase family protein/MazG family protein